MDRNSRKNEFVHESFQDRESIVRYLNSLVECFGQGRLQLCSGSDEMVIEIPGLVKFDVRAKQKHDRTQVVLKMTWKNRSAGRDLQVRPSTPQEPQSPDAHA